MVNSEELPDAAEFVRWLARQGKLKEYVQSATREERRRLRAGAGEIVWPLVFTKVTRRLEHSRGHFSCATGVQYLRPNCLDRFHDDVEAVIDHLFDHADVEIHNLEGWLTMCLQRATVDAHRRRRSERGAAQRPRLAMWLKKALGEDPWLMELAELILEWVGVEATAGSSVWPLSAWTEVRALRTGDHGAGEATLSTDIDVVLAAMRRRPRWHEQNIERPLGRKQAAVWVPPRAADGVEREPEPLALVLPHEVDDALLSGLAAAAIDAIRHRVRLGEKPIDVVPEVLETVFGGAPATVGDVPGRGVSGPEQVMALITDPDRLDRIVATLIDLLAEKDD